MKEKSKCLVEWCTKVSRACGYCEMHYRQIKRSGCVTPQARVVWKRTQKGSCCVDGCLLGKYSRNMCKFHYNQWIYKERKETRKEQARNYHHEHARERMLYKKQRYQQTKEQVKKKAKMYYEKHRRIAIEIYGSKCSQCGIKDDIVLEFHHCFGNPKKERYLTYINKIVQAGCELKEYMLLCANCHIKQNKIDGTSQIGNR